MAIWRFAFNVLMNQTRDRRSNGLYGTLLQAFSREAEMRVLLDKIILELKAYRH